MKDIPKVLRSVFAISVIGVTAFLISHLFVETHFEIKNLEQEQAITEATRVFREKRLENQKLKAELKEVLFQETAEKELETMTVTATGYSSTPDQTDLSPFITASGEYVYEGTLAVNFLPFGTQIKFPDLYGEKVFVVEDRLARKNGHKVDIWFQSREEAQEFGIKTVKMIIVK